MRSSSAAPIKGCRLGRNAYSTQCMGVLTSGGDSQGMNAAVRACVRTAIYLGCKVFLIHEGYQGMVDGGEHIVEAHWVSVSSIIHRGGTVIGSARCEAFREREGRLKAAYNLVLLGITNLVVIGGDGSLTAANIFCQEWPGLLDELVTLEQIKADMRKQYGALNVVGIVGSIDNDFCGTDMTIGTDSALHRIIEALDSIVSTATSHQRTFVVEVMGRNCGYLALVTGIISEAEFVFCPETPPPSDWRTKLCRKLDQERTAGQRVHIIVIAEGAVDERGEPLSAEDVKAVIVDNLQRDTRITVLGHVQRGGMPSAYDRILACRMGAAATMALMEATDSEETQPVVIAIDDNEIIQIPLMKNVENTQAVATALANKDWEEAVKLRGSSFGHNVRTMKLMTRLKPKDDAIKCQGAASFHLAVMHVGAPACGMNAVVASFVRNSIMRGDSVVGIYDGFEGLLKGNVKELRWSNVIGWVAEGGSFLGCKRTLPQGFLPDIAAKFKELNIQGLLIVGGFEAYLSCLQLSDERAVYPEFCIPLAVIPATISNNVPGTDYSVGCDTCLNEITEICDRIRRSAQGTNHRAFIIETMGGYCGYLATMAGIASGADVAYIFEEKFSVKDLAMDIRHMASKMNEGVKRGMILRNERASQNYTTDFIHRLYAEEGKHIFSCRMNVLGHMQQGGIPTSFDRNMGTKMSSKCSEWISDQLISNVTPDGNVRCTSRMSAVMVGHVGHGYKITPLDELIADTDFEHRIPKHQWWMRLRPLLKILAKHTSAYKDDENSKRNVPLDVNCTVN